MSAADASTVTRREMVQSTSRTIALTVLTAAAATGACGEAEARDWRPLYMHGHVNIGPARHYHAGTVSLKYLHKYGIVISNDGGTITAISPICTHRGCTTHWDGRHSEFICPCHHARYNIAGVVVHGPARQPLHRVATHRHSDGTLSVNLAEFRHMKYPFVKRLHHHH